MNTRYTTVNLDVSQQGSIPSITLSQYDLGVGLGFYIMDGGLPYSEFAETDTVVLSGTKPSGVGFTVPAYYKSGNLCSFRTPQAMTTEAGTVTCEITITKSNNISVSTANFFVEVEAAAHAHEVIDEDIEDFGLIANQVGEYKAVAVRAAQQAAQSATDAAASAGSAEESMEAAQSAASSAIAAKDDIQEYIDDSEAWAKGTRGGTAVPSTDETYENNAKYYAEQSSEASMAAGSSASEAAASAQEAAATLAGAVKPAAIDTEFSTSTAYAVGDTVVYQGRLYEFTSAHAAGAWNASHVQAISVMGEVSDLKSDLNKLEAIPDGSDLNDYYNPGEYSINTNGLNISNFPIDNVYTSSIEVFKYSSNGAFQRLTLLGNGNIYVRSRYWNGTWSAWTSVTNTDNYVKTVSQSLTEEQKNSARANIDAVSVDSLSSIELDISEIDNALNAEIENRQGGQTNLSESVSLLSQNKVNQPLSQQGIPIIGTYGQALRTNGDGTTSWADLGLPTNEQTYNAISDWLEDHPEAVTTVEDGSITESKLSDQLNKSLNRNYVIVEKLKTFYPSYTDDQLLNLAITLAKQNGEGTLIVWDGADIHFTGETTHECKGFSGIDFNGSKIYMPDYDNGCILNIVPDESSDITVTASSIFDTYTTDDNLKGKVFAFNDDYDGNADMCLGNRTTSGSSAVLYCAPAVKTTPDGCYVTGKLYLTPSSGNVVCYNVHDYPARTFEICNAEIISNSSNKMSKLLTCSRSNTHIHNLVFSGQSTVNSFHDGIMEITRCCNVEIDHISGVNPIKESLTSGYAFLLTSASFIYIHDVYVGDGEDKSWGVVGANNICNTTFERCAFNRWDCHYAQYGFNVVRDCTLNRIQYGIGCGTLLFENCIIIEKRTSSSALNMIEKRSDCVGVFDGDIVVRNCTFVPGQQATNLLRVWVDSDYYQKPSNAMQTVDANGMPGRYLEKCILPVGVKNIFFVGSRFSSDEGQFEHVEYHLKDTGFNCSDSIIDTYNNTQILGGLIIDHCRCKNQCYASRKIYNVRLVVINTNYEGKTVKVDKNIAGIYVSNSVLSSVVSDETSSFLMLTGCRLFGTQDFTKFNNYAAYGNVYSSRANTKNINVCVQ